MEKMIADYQFSLENKEQIERLNQITKTALQTQNQEQGITQAKDI